MTSMTELLDAVTAAYSAVAELSLFLRVAWGVLILWAVGADVVAALRPRRRADAGGRNA